MRKIQLTYFPQKMKLVTHLWTAVFQRKAVKQRTDSIGPVINY